MTTPRAVVVGSANVDVRLRVPALPGRGETLLAHDAQRFPGGKGANQAVALARLGDSVGLVAALGDDTDSQWLLHRLLTERVDTSHVVTVPGTSAGQAIVFALPDGDNSIIVAPGANASLPVDAVRSARGWLAEAAVVLAQCEIPMPAVLEAAILTGGTFIFNPAPAAALPDALWSHIDVLVPNRGELQRLVGAPRPLTNTAEVEAAARRLPCPRVVVTLGSRGALVIDDDQTHNVAAPTVTVRDTTGAGDFFCAALAHRLADGLDLTAASRFAVAVAAASVERVGAQGGATALADMHKPT